MNLLLFFHTAFARDAVSLEVVSKGVVDGSKPTLFVLVNQDLNSLKVKLSCGSRSFEVSQNAVRSGQKIPLTLDVEKGSHNCKGSLDVEFSNDATGSMPLTFKAEVIDPPQIIVPIEKVDLENSSLFVRLNRPAKVFQIEIIDTDLDEVGSGILHVPVDSNLSLQKIDWTAAGETAIIRVKGEDVHGFWSQMDLLPWHYEIPHEEIVFASNSAQITADEAPKLADVQSKVEDVVEKYKKIAEVNLYIAGYTDTVGSQTHNLNLSTQRARSIALWFQENGFQGSVYYQGFGEDVLAVPTPDNTDEEQNRRALYVVAAQPPPFSQSIPKDAWKKLD